MRILTNVELDHMRHWRQAIGVLHKRDGRFVEIVRGAKNPVMPGWNQTENTLSANEAMSLLNKGRNVGLATGSGNLYIFDFDDSAERGHESDHLSGGLYFYRSNAPQKAKFVFQCEEALPTRHKNSHGIELLGLNGNGTHAQGVIAGLHTSGAPIVWGGHCVPVLDADTVAELWKEWTDSDLFAPEPVERDPQTYDLPSVARLADALKHIDPNSIDYNTWQGIIAAIHDTVGDAALPAVIDWADGKPGEVEKKWISYSRPYSGPKRTLLTVYYLARKGGWVDPTYVADTTLDLSGLQPWAGSAACLALFKQRGISRPSGLQETLGHLVRLAHDRNSHKVYISCRELANMIGTSAMSISRRLQKMADINIVTLTTQGKGQIVDFTPILLDRSVTVSSYKEEMEEGVTLRSSEFWGRHTGDDAFKSYPYAYAVKRRMNDKSPLMTSLGAAGYLLWPRLEQGGTLKELAEMSGLSVATVRAAVKKFLSCGLLEVDESDREKAYVLVANAEEKLDELRPHMVTAFVGQMRVARNHGETATYAAFKLRQRKKMEPRDVMWWENLRDDADRRAAVIFESLKTQGYDAAKKVGKEKAIRARRRYDYGEEWRTWGRPLFDAFNALTDMPQDQRAHSLTLSVVPKDAGEEQFHRALLEMRERIRMMQMMAPKRAKYERTEMEEEVTPQEKTLWSVVEGTAVHA